MMLSILLPLLALSPVCLAQAEAGVSSPKPLNVYHRLYHPSHAPNVPFALRGTLSPSDDRLGYVLEPVEMLEDDVSSFREDLKEILAGERLYEASYQLALEREGDTSEGHWDISGVKMCHIASDTTGLVVLHLSWSLKPFAIDYFVSSTPHEGSCPELTKQSKEALNTALLKVSESGINSTVVLKHSHLPPLPELRTPPPLTAQGEPVQPVAEKTFLQKYWFYIVGVVVAILISSGGEEERKSTK